MIKTSEIKSAVITHKTPDFDAVAGACAARFLHGCDLVLTATSYEPNVDKFIKDHAESELPIRRLKDKEIEEIGSLDLLVITDCKLAERLGSLAVLAERAKKIIIYDHHPAHGMDMEGDESYVEELGASVTIIYKRIEEAGLEIPERLASLMALGIYEDTGLLTFKSTTPDDIRTAAKLLERGADLDYISEYIKRDLSREHVFVLNELLLNMMTMKFHGISVGVSQASVDKYLGEIAYLAHRIMDMEGMDALFIAVRAGERIVLIGRSRVDEVNASSVIYRFGGGGHPTAASSIVKDMTLHETMEKLRSVIREEVRPVRYAGDIMTSPVKSVPVTESFETAMDLFMKYNLNMMPVVENGLPVGLISRKDILSGMKHGLKGEPVNSLMQIEFETVEPDIPYYEAERVMLNNNQKMLPVVREGKLLGVITRTDLLRMMHEEISRMPRYMHGRTEGEGPARIRVIKSLLENRMSERITAILKEVGELASKMGYSAYLVGGVVRDLLMDRENMDIDIVVEGDAPKLAKRFAQSNGARVSEHFKFKTAVVIFPDDFRVDFATSRTEFYTNPAAAPEVENASIRNDLYRRDFSINAMAVKLNGEDFAQLLDFFGGQRDLKDGKVRVLHSLSFVDDPSRALRGIRFAVRFGFDIGPHTEKLLKHAVSLSLIDRIVGQRLFMELKYILSENAYIDALHMMKRYDLLRFFHPKVILDDAKLRRFDAVKRINGWYCFQFEDKPELWKARFAILFNELGWEDMKSLAERFELSPKLHDELIKSFFDMKSALGRLKKLDEPNPAMVTETLEVLDTEFILAAGAFMGEDFEWLLKEYFSVYRFVEPELDGNDLKSMGIPPSSMYGDIFEEIRRRKLNGTINNIEQEKELAMDIYRDRGDS